MQYNKDEVYNRTLSGSPAIPPLSQAIVPGAMPVLPNSSWQTGVAFHQVQGHILGSTGVSNCNSFNGETLNPIEFPFRFDDDLGAPFLAPTHEQTVNGYVLHHLTMGIQEGSGGTA